jgi:hypothetical protein
MLSLTLRVVRLDLVGQQVQYFLSHIPGFWQICRKSWLSGVKLATYSAVFIHPELAFILFVMGVFADFEMVHFVIRANRDRCNFP